MRSHRTDQAGVRYRRSRAAPFAVVVAVVVSALAAPAAAGPGRGRDGTRPATSQVLVRFRENAGRGLREAALARVRGVRVGTVFGEPTAIVRVPAGLAVPAAASLRSAPGVAWAEPDGVARIAAPNDPKFPEQYALRNNGQTGGLVDADIDAPAGWAA